MSIRDDYQLAYCKGLGKEFKELTRTQQKKCLKAVDTAQKRTHSMFATVKKRDRIYRKPTMLTLEEIRDMVLYFLTTPEKKCKYCGENMTIDTISLDHVIPLSLNEGTSIRNNVTFICKRCNTRKGKLTGHSYKKLLKLLDTFHPDERKYILTKLSKDGGVNGYYKAKAKD